MDYEALWRAMAELITEIRKSGETVQSSIMRDLRSAKTMIQISKVDKDNPEHLSRIEEYLSNVEAYLIDTALRKFGSQYAYRWMERLEEARKSVVEEAKPSTKFVTGVPRDQHWIRIKTSSDTPVEEIKKLAAETDLKYRIQEEDHILVYGEKDKIKDFVRRIAESHGK